MTSEVAMNLARDEGLPHAYQIGTPAACRHHLPIRPHPVRDEALDAYLERLATENLLDHPALLAQLHAHTTYLAIAPSPELTRELASLTGLSTGDVAAMTTTGMAGIDDLRHGGERTDGWRHAGRSWAPGRGSQLCPTCLTHDRIWRITWRHPWMTVCLEHNEWLHALCPGCGRPFRIQRHSPLRSVDAAPGTCGNPAGARGRTCGQDLTLLARTPAPNAVLETQRRIDTAIHHTTVDVLGQAIAPDAYLTEVKVLTDLLLHLACQPGADDMASWAAAARADREQSAGGRGARWSLAPPTDVALRGLVLADADAILAAPDLDTAAAELGPWLDLTPTTNDGQLGWLADHTTTMSSLLARLVMAATSSRHRIATHLSRTRTSMSLALVPQVLPAELYDDHLTGKLGITEAAGRVFASLCLARRGRPSTGWAGAAPLLGLPEDLGTKAARACSGQLLCSLVELIRTIDDLAVQLARADVDYRRREAAVRRLATRTRWYRAWAREHQPGSHETSRRYAVTWLWTDYAGGHLTTSPGWTHPPTTQERAYYRRYADRLNTPARQALLRLASAVERRRR